MRKILYIMTAVLGLTACAQEDIIKDESNIESNEAVTKYMTANLAVGSRINIEGYKLTWSKGDDFKVFNADWTLSDAYMLDPATEGNASGRFVLNNKKDEAGQELPQQVDNAVHAIFPRRSYPVLDTQDPTKLHVKLVSKYDLSANGGDKFENAPMLGTVVNNTTVKFTKLLTAMLKINCGYFPEGYTSLRVVSYGQGAQSIAGVCELDVNAADKKLVNRNHDKNQVEILGLDRTQPVYIPLPENTYDLLKVFAVNPTTHDQMMVAEIHNKLFECSMMYTINAGGLVTPASDLTTDGWKAVQHNTSSVTLKDINDGQVWKKALVINNTHVKQWGDAIGCYQYTHSLLGMTSIDVRMRAQVPVLDTFTDSKNEQKNRRIGIAVRTADGMNSFVQGNKNTYGTSPIDQAMVWTDIVKGIDLTRVGVKGNTSSKPVEASTAAQLRGGFQLQIFANESPYIIEVTDVQIVPVYGQPAK